MCWPYPSRASPCHTSRQDLVCFNYQRSFLALIKVVDKKDTYPPDFNEKGECQQVKGIKIEEKNDEEDSLQQLLGGGGGGGGVGGGQSNGRCYCVTCVQSH